MRARSLALVIALSSALSSVLLPSIVRADETCVIEGELSGVDVVVRRARGIRRVRFAAPRRVAITPLRPGIARVRTLDGDAIEGTTRSPLHYVVARPLSLREGSLELPRGMPIGRVDVAPHGPWIEISVALGDGLFLRGAPVPCDAVTLAVDAETEIIPREPITLSGPRWRPRTERLYVFPRPDDDSFLRIDAVPESTAHLIELQRRPGWVRVAFRTALGARLRAWTQDTSLIR
ncbi:MAG: hypothetical protein M3Y87_31530 [Myxococcota bacterium]|nr:hypothetical protein [Myxococcota bacterium]